MGCDLFHVKYALSWKTRAFCRRTAVNVTDWCRHGNQRLSLCVCYITSVWNGDRLDSGVVEVRGRTIVWLSLNVWWISQVSLLPRRSWLPLVTESVNSRFFRRLEINRFTGSSSGSIDTTRHVIGSCCLFSSFPSFSFVFFLSSDFLGTTATISSEMRLDSLRHFGSCHWTKKFICFPLPRQNWMCNHLVVS